MNARSKPLALIALFREFECLLVHAGPLIPLTNTPEWGLGVPMTCLPCDFHISLCVTFPEVLQLLRDVRIADRVLNMTSYITSYFQRPSTTETYIWSGWILSYPRAKSHFEDRPQWDPSNFWTDVCSGLNHCQKELNWKKVKVQLTQPLEGDQPLKKLG